MRCPACGGRLWWWNRCKRCGYVDQTPGQIEMFEEKPVVMPGAILMDGSPTEPKTLSEAIGQALGAASVCWENPGGAGIFDSTRAKQISEELLEGIRTGLWPDDGR